MILKNEIPVMVIFEQKQTQNGSSGEDYDEEDPTINGKLQMLDVFTRRQSLH